MYRTQQWRKKNPLVHCKPSSTPKVISRTKASTRERKLDAIKCFDASLSPKAQQQIIGMKTTSLSKQYFQIPTFESWPLKFIIWGRIMKWWFEAVPNYNLHPFFLCYIIYAEIINGGVWHEKHTRKM